jgi:hypothetical protein
MMAASGAAYRVPFFIGPSAMTRAGFEVWTVTTDSRRTESS